MLSKDQILSANDLPTVTLDVPEWDGRVRIRTMTAGDRDKYEKSFIGRDGTPSIHNALNPRATLVALCMIDEQGQRLFSDAEVEVLANKSAAALDRVMEAAAKLNRVTKDDVEELAGN